MPTSRNSDFSPCMKPGYQRANLDEETADWRAVCGRTACTVRREGRGIPSLPLSRVKWRSIMNIFTASKRGNELTTKNSRSGQSDPGPLKPEAPNLVAQTACGFRISCTSAPFHLILQFIVHQTRQDCVAALGNSSLFPAGCALP